MRVLRGNARPGPTLDDVKAELSQPDDHIEERRKASRAVFDASRAALVQEAAELAARDDSEFVRMDRADGRSEFDSGSPTETDADGDAEAEPRPGSLTRHRFTKDRVETGNASKVAVLRDRRRGRRSGDPPK